MNHKRKGPKSTRSGCLMCKPHKRQGVDAPSRQEQRGRDSERFHEEETTMSSTSLHILRQRLNDHCRSIANDSFSDLDSATVEEWVKLVEAVDRQLTGKSVPRHQYIPHVTAMLEGDVWHWHLADGGYSRITINIPNFFGEVRRLPMISLDRGLSTEKVIAAWDAANGGSQ